MEDWWCKLMILQKSDIQQSWTFSCTTAFMSAINMLSQLNSKDPHGYSCILLCLNVQKIYTKLQWHAHLHKLFFFLLKTLVIRCRQSCSLWAVAKQTHAMVQPGSEGSPTFDTNHAQKHSLSGIYILSKMASWGFPLLSRIALTPYFWRLMCRRIQIGRSCCAFDSHLYQLLSYDSFTFRGDCIFSSAQDSYPQDK